jgi:transcriptional regulator with XRE-family HTH domain
VGALGDELAKVLLRNRKAFRFTQSELGERIGTSGSYISSLETGKASPRIEELEAMASCFRTTALALVEESAHADDRFVPLVATADDACLDVIAADLSEERRRLAREFLLFLRERERVDRA